MKAGTSPPSLPLAIHIKPRSREPLFLSLSPFIHAFTWRAFARRDDYTTVRVHALLLRKCVSRATSAQCFSEKESRGGRREQQSQAHVLFRVRAPGCGPESAERERERERDGRER